ncbi:MAG: DNA-processing protein DprA [Candidatus Saccharimonadales bacterium]
MTISTITRRSSAYPQLLREIAHPPKQLYVCGELRTDLPLVAIVGTRKPTRYGREITARLSGDLAQTGIGIVSGLALGCDAIAHRAALEAGGYTIAIMACGLDRLYPATNRQLGIRILRQKGVIISEYDSGMPPLKQNFAVRNRIISGLTLGVVITEAAERSGSLITATFALEQNREVMAVPGNITSPLSAGTNNLIKAGATPVTSAGDILTALDLATTANPSLAPSGSSPDEAAVLALLAEGVSDGDELLQRLEWEPARFNQVITLLELSGKVRSLGGGKWISN